MHGMNNRYIRDIEFGSVLVGPMETIMSRSTFDAWLLAVMELCSLSSESSGSENTARLLEQAGELERAAAEENATSDDERSDGKSS